MENQKKEIYLKKDRLEMFTDGVFAIAITLLILEIKIPKHEQVHEAGGLYNYLKHIWPSYVSYFITFFMIGIYWSNHHWMFEFIIKRTNHFFNMLNILFLMTIAFMPFTTAIFGDFVMDHEYCNAATTAYCVGVLLPIPPVLFLFLYAKHKKRLIDPRLTASFMKKQIIKLIASVTIASIALAFSFNYPWVSITMILVTFVMFFLPPDAPEYDDIIEKSK
jgi:uncharacterized membrane protein